MIRVLEAASDRLLARLVPRATATAASVQTCGTVWCGYCWRCVGGICVRYECYRTCCDNPGHPASCGSCQCPC